jgi:hypothetical protein
LILQEVLKNCEQDSEYILTIISKLRTEKTAGSVGKSFKAAFKTVWKKDEIKRLEERLMRSQGVLHATMGRISKYLTTLHHITYYTAILITL